MAIVLKIDRANWGFLKFNMRHKSRRHVTWGLKCSDMRHSHFLKSACDVEENNRQRDAALLFLKIDMRHLGPPIKGPR